MNTRHCSETNGTAERAFESGLLEQWWDYATTSCCNLRNVHDKMADGKTTDQKSMCVQCDGPLIPFAAKVSYKPISSKDEARLHQFGKTYASWNLHGISITYGMRRVRRFAHRGLRMLRKPANVPSTRKSHKKESCFLHVQTDLSNSSMFLHLHAAKCPRGKP